MDTIKRNKIYALAKLIRDTFNLQTPIDLVDLVENYLQGEIVSEKLDSDIAGKIERQESGSFKITVNERKNTTDGRKNFTIAHELGHLFLHMGFLLNENKWNEAEAYIDSVYYRFGYSEEEYEANQFAAALLMPEKEYKQKISELKNKFIGTGNNIGLYIKELAEYFNVSKEAVITRGKWIGIFRW